MLFASTALNYSIHTFLRRDFSLYQVKSDPQRTSLLINISYHCASTIGSMALWYLGSECFFGDVVGPIHVTHRGNAGKLSYRAVDYFLSDYINSNFKHYS